ncbi:MAG: helix-turn-helix transcriptional regulator [Ruminococcaceae bacterium]|nr:helix-turn-helix transcriptional regulator [Oscillospiraceae bacterium]
MQPRFYIEREKAQDVFYKEYVNGTGFWGVHSPVELYFVDDGEMEVFINNRKKLLKKNQMSVALSFDAHTYKTVKSSKSSVLIIPTYMCEEFVAEVKHRRPISPYICDEKTVIEIKKYVKKLNREGINSIQKKGFIYVILGIIMDNLSFKDVNDIIDVELSTKLLMYLNDNFTKDISLATVSAAFGYNKSYISRYFKNCFGIGLNRYITIARLNNAITLMNEEGNTVTYCALESGFNSMRTFYRCFAEEFKCTPKEYINEFGKTS